jgi:TRAP-type mannitol/chloroaromatic compound transport system substrate-binding protein
MKGAGVIVGLVVGVVVGIVIGVFGFAGNGDEGGGGADTAATDTAAPEAKPVRWKMASAFGSQWPIQGELGMRFIERVDAVSGGTIKIQFFEPGALVPALEIFDSVSSGAIDSGFTTAGYWAGKVPALQFFTAVPFGPNAMEYAAWLYYGGGDELYEEIYRPYNIKAMHCGVHSPEGSGWFRKPIESLDDLKGLKMRFFGLGARVMEKLGVTTQLIAGGDIFPALELGTIDATEYSMPSIDLNMGFYQVAKHYYFPGWHQPSSIFELMINMERWNELNEQQQAIIEIVCGDNYRAGLGLSEAAQAKALTELKEKGVVFHRWSDEIIETLRAAWLEVEEEEAAKDETFRKVLDSFKAFRAEYRVWADLGYVR